MAVYIGHLQLSAVLLPTARMLPFICATLDINGFAVGSVLSITGTAADAMVGVTGVAAATLLATPIVLTCVTSGIITVTFGAASTGAIAWEILWIPLNAAGALS